LKKENLNDLDYSYINELSNLLQHQEFLLKILTDKKSWVRMQIIEQNLGLLNYRLDYYTKQLGLPHTVRFVSDLSVEITNVGQNFDFDNLSTGESTRLILALNWAFRDVFEAMYFPINLMFIDELVDSGMDSSGGENALAVLKHITREKKKNIFLISHKDEFVARVSNVLMVTKENGFTEYKYETDLQI
jgi:DNA repair exonuclease SbcCD ATPase subunit